VEEVSGAAGSAVDAAGSSATVAVATLGSDVGASAVASAAVIGPPSCSLVNVVDLLS
jgi:hypothetical protein